MISRRSISTLVQRPGSGRRSHPAGIGAAASPRRRRDHANHAPPPRADDPSAAETNRGGRRGAVGRADHHRRPDVVDRTVHAVGRAGATGCSSPSTRSTRPAGVGGRPLELRVVDDESNPEAGTSGIERLIEEGAVAVGGIISSDVGLATTP